MRTAAKVIPDLLIVGLAVVAAYVIRFERLPGVEFGTQMVWLAITLPLVRLAVGRAMGIHRSSWRLFGLTECLLLIRATATVTLALVVVRLVTHWLRPELTVIPFGIIALESLFSLSAMLALRISVRLVDEHQARRAVIHSRGVQRTLLVGAGRAGRMAARELRARPDAGYAPVGFLDDDPQRVGQIIEGVPVLGSTADAAALARKTDAEVLILTMPSVGRTQARAVVERCREAALPIHTVPGLYELLAGTVGIAKIRPLKIEDLLGREVVAFDELAIERVRRAFGGRRILVTGAGGSIGSELCRQLTALRPDKLIVVDNHENHLFEIEQELRRALGDRVVACLTDVRVVAEVEEVFAEHRPQVVFHAAAYKHVPMMEAHPRKAVLNNVRGTRVVAEAALAFGSERFLLVSTDKAVNPTSVMGATKRAAELAVLSMPRSTTRFSAVRFGNVLASAGSVVHTFSQQIAAGGPITLTHPDITRFFMTIPEAVRLVLQATTIGEGGDLFVLDMGEPVKIIDLARQMIRLAGLEEGEIAIEIIGLRPGEKLHEELLSDTERGEQSTVPSVWVSRSSPVPVPSPRTWVLALEEAAETGAVEYALRLLSVGTGYREPSPQEHTDPGIDLDDLREHADAHEHGDPHKHTDRGIALVGSA